MQTDVQTVRKAKRGDLQAVEALVRANQDRVFRLAVCMLPSTQDAEDVTQETFIEACAHLSRFREDSSFTTWVLSIARTRVANWYRKRKPEELRSEVESDGHQECELALVARLDLQEAISRLPEAQREVIALRYGAELEIKEIAEILGVSLEAATIRLHQKNAPRDAIRCSGGVYK